MVLRGPSGDRFIALLALPGSDRIQAVGVVIAPARVKRGTAALSPDHQIAALPAGEIDAAQELEQAAGEMSMAMVSMWPTAGGRRRARKQSRTAIATRCDALLDEFETQIVKVAGSRRRR
jgi:hypothetical protein